MILADTSAWIEMLRATESSLDATMVDLIDSGTPLHVTEPVVMELLAGTRSQHEWDALSARLRAFPLLRVGGLSDFEAAAAVYRTCRAGGASPRGLIDCLIAAAAIRAGAEILHADADYNLIARHTPLRVHEASMT